MPKKPTKSQTFIWNFADEILEFSEQVVWCLQRLPLNLMKFIIENGHDLYELKISIDNSTQFTQKTHSHYYIRKKRLWFGIETIESVDRVLQKQKRWLLFNCRFVQMDDDKINELNKWINLNERVISRNSRKQNVIQIFWNYHSLTQKNQFASAKFSRWHISHKMLISWSYK